MDVFFSFRSCCVPWVRRRLLEGSRVMWPWLRLRQGGCHDIFANILFSRFAIPTKFCNFLYYNTKFSGKNIGENQKILSLKKRYFLIAWNFASRRLIWLSSRVRKMAKNGENFLSWWAQAPVPRGPSGGSLGDLKTSTQHALDFLLNTHNSKGKTNVKRL